MGRLVCYGLALFFFFFAGKLGMEPPKVNTPEGAFGHYGAVAIVAGIGFLFLLAPWGVGKLLARASDNDFTAATESAQYAPQVPANPDAPHVPPAWGLPLLVAILVALVAVPAYHWRWVADGLGGPKPVSNDDLAACEDLEALPTRWVKVRPDEVIETQVSFDKKSKYAPPVKHVYVLLRVGDKYLLAVLPEYRKGQYTGYLCEVPKGDANESAVRRKFPQLAERMLPCEFRCAADSDTWMSCLGLAGLCLFFALPTGMFALTVAAQSRRAGGVPADPKTAAARQLLAGQPTFGRSPVLAPASPLGRLVSEHGPTGVRRSTVLYALAGVALVLVAGALGGVVATGVSRAAEKGEDAPAWVYGIPAFPGFIALCCFAASWATARPRPTVRLYTGGIELASAEGTRAFRWNEVVNYRAPTDQFTGTWLFDLANGETVRFDAIQRVFEFRHAFFNDHGLPDLVLINMQRLKAGETVYLGDIAMSLDAITLGKHVVPWAQVKQAVFHVFPRRSEKVLRVEVAGWMFTWQSRNLWTMRSAELFEEVLRRVAPPRVWQG